MKLTQGEKRIEIGIDSYEFPYDENGLYEDNNWLNVTVEWEDDVVLERAVSSCLTTSELSDLCKGLGKVLMNEPYQSDFIEPDLTIQAKVVHDLVQIQVSYAKAGHHRFYIDSEITKAQLDEIISDIHEMCIQYPIRVKKVFH